MDVANLKQRLRTRPISQRRAVPWHGTSIESTKPVARSTDQTK